METPSRAPRRPWPLRLAWVLAACLPLQGLAVGMGSVTAPAHFHVDEPVPAHGHGHGYDDEDDHGHPHPHPHPHAHAHAHAHDEPHAAVGHHAHDVDDGSVVYLAASQDGEAGGAATPKNPPAGLEALGLAVQVPALSRAAPERPQAGAAGFRSRVVAPLEQPPR